MQETGFQFGVYKGTQTGGGGNVTQWNEVQIIYVGKHGHDANNGRSINQAKLTIQGGINQAFADGASAGTRFVVCVLDAGTYAETLEIFNYVKVFAPNATINAIGAIGITMEELSAIECDTINAPDGEAICFANVTNADYDASVIVRLMTVLTDKDCCCFTDTYAGSVSINIDQMYVVDGACVHNSNTNPDFRLTGFVNEMIASGSGGGIVSDNAASIQLTVNHIKADIGISLSSTAIVRILADYIECGRGQAINITGGNSYIFANKIDGSVTIADNVVAVVEVSKRNNYGAIIAPVATDDAGDGYSIGSAWVDTLTKIIYDCVDATVGAAIWIQRASGAGWIPQRKDFIAAAGQDTFLLPFVPLYPAKLNVYVLGVIWQSSRYVVSYDGVLLTWQVVLDTPQGGGEDVIVTE